jgi:hypothetical protein
MGGESLVDVIVNRGTTVLEALLDLVLIIM